jgi:hypothetical protein
MPITLLQKRLRALLLALFACGMVHSAHATLIVNSTVADLGGGKFHWDFSITNPGPVDIALVSLITAPIGDPFIGSSLSAPPDFLALYDDLLGIVDFVEGATVGFAAGTTAEFFGFDSAAGPGAGFFNTFTALDVFGNELTGSVRIPEPVGLSLLALGGLLVGVSSQNKRRTQFRPT